MPEQLKIIIDADAQPASTELKNFGKVFAGEFGKITSTASLLEKSIASSIQNINSSLSSLKITSLDVNVNTSSIDASIKNIQAKFSALVDPELNVLANTEQAEFRIKELLSELSTIENSEFFINGNNAQALQEIKEVKTELKSLLDKQVRLNVDSSGVRSASKAVSGEFVTAIKTAESAGDSLEAKFTAISTRINASIDKMVADALSGFSQLKSATPDFGVLSFDNSKALSAVREVKAELSTVVVKPITIPVDTAQALAKIDLLERQILELETLKVSPGVSTQQFALFESAIQKLKVEIAGLKSGVVNVNTSTAQRNINTLSDSIELLQAKIQAKKAIVQIETDVTKVVALNQEIERLEDRVRSLQNVGKKGFEIFVVPNQTINSVKSLTASVAAFGGGVKTFIPPAVASFSRLSPSINSAVSSLQKLPNNTNAASFAMLNFGRIIQDAPFGILGVANNLNPFIESMGRASAAAKETGTSLSKNLLGSLTGVGGLGLAVSAISSLLLVFGRDLFSTKSAADLAKNAVDDFNASLATTKTRFDNLSTGISFRSLFKKVQAEAGGKEGEELDVFGLQNEIKANKERIKALDAQAAPLVKSFAKINKAIDDARAAQVKRELESPGQDVSRFKDPIVALLDRFKNVNLKDIPESAIEELNKKDQAAVRGIISINSAISENLSKRNDLIDENELNSLRIIAKNNSLSKELRDKALKDLEDSQNKIIARARQFKKEFGDAFVLPDLEESFFVGKDQIFKNAVKVLNDVQKDLSKQAAITELKIKLPVLVTTETKLNADDLKKFLRGEITRDQVREFRVTIPIVTDLDIPKIAEGLEKEVELSQKIIDGFFKGIGQERNIPVNIIPDLSLSKDSIEQINKKLDLRKQFTELGNLGRKAFEKIDFTNLNTGIETAKVKLSELKILLDGIKALGATVGKGLSDGVISMVEAIEQGKNPLKAFFRSIIDSVNQLIKRLIAAAIQAAVLSALSGGGSTFGQSFLKVLGIGGSANFGQLSGIGNRAFNNVLTVNVVGQVSGDTILLAGQRAANSQGRFG